MKLAKVIYDRHLFVLASQDIIKNLAVYRTCNGPIFAVFSTGGTVKRYINGEGKLLASFECSHDLRNKPTDEDYLRMMPLLKKYFKYKNPEELMNKVQKVAGRLASKKIDVDMRDRLEKWKPAYGKGFTYQELLDMGADIIIGGENDRKS